MMRLDLNRPELAINGGKPVRTLPWTDNFTTGQEEKKAVIRVLDSGYLSKFEGSYTPDPPFSFFGGPEVQALEREWCDFYESSHAISMNSATSGLFAAIGALGLGFGDEVIVSPYTMTACALAPLIYGAIPVFADVEEATGCLDPISIKKCISERTRAILVVHQFGIPADMVQITKIAEEHSLKIIEDCAQAHGAKYHGDFVGKSGDIGVFSLNVNKSIQSGEGAVCITENEDLAYRLALIRNHGEAVVGPAGIDNITNIGGFNYRLTEIQAAIAREQLKKLPDLNRHRLTLVEMLSDQLREHPFLLPPEGRERCLATYYVYPLRFSPNDVDVKRDKFVTAVNKEGAQFYQGYVQPLYLQPLYQKQQLWKHGYPFSAPENQGHSGKYAKGTCPVAEDLHYEKMIINEHVRWPHTTQDMKELVDIIEKVTGWDSGCSTQTN